MRDDVNTRSLRTSLVAAARLGREVSEVIERGQAEMPLAARFEEIAGAVETRPFALVLVGLSQQARSSALAWLCGQDFGHVSVSVPPDVGLVELHLQERGYVLEQGGATRLEFDRLDHFLAAIQRADLVRPGDPQSWIDPLSLRMAAPKGLQGLLISMPENLPAIAASPAMFSRLVATSNLLVVAGMDGQALEPAERAALRELADSMDVVWPLVVGTPSVPHSGFFTDPEAFSRCERIPPVALPADPVAPRPPVVPLVADPADPLRQALFLAHHGRTLRLASQALEERHRSELRSLASRQATITRQQGALEDSSRAGADLRSGFEAEKAALDETFSRMASEIDEASRRAMLPTGPLLARVRDRVAELRVEDIRQELAPHAIRLSVDEAFVRGLKEDVERLLRSQLKEDLALVRDRVRGSLEGASARLSALRGSPVRVDVAPPDEKRIWDPVTQAFVLEVRYRGELPKRSVMQRISEGRRPVMMFVMLLSLFGGVFGVTRRNPWVQWATMALFVGGFAYTFISFRGEEDERLAREVDRVREALSEEVRRAIAEAQRGKASRLEVELAEIKRAAVLRVDGIAKEAAAQLAERGNEEKERLRARSRSLDQRLREFQQHAGRVAKVVQSVGDVEVALRRAISDLARARKPERVT